MQERVSCFHPPPVAKIRFFYFLPVVVSCDALIQQLTNMLGGRRSLIRSPTMMKYFKPLKLYHHLLQLKNTDPLLGLHVGRQGVGVSISDDNKTVARPLAWIVRTKTNIDFVASEFQTLISEFSPSGLVIGYPSRKNTASRERFILRFVDELTKTGKFEDMKYTFRDESYTEKALFERANFRKGNKEHPMFPKAITDEFAAFEILQGYLDIVNRYQDQTFASEER